MPFNEKFSFFSLSRIDLIPEKADPALEKNYELYKKLSATMQQLRLSPVPRTVEEHQQITVEKTVALQLMETIKQKNLYEFIREVNVEIEKLNELIEQYNLATTLDDRLTLLNQIDAYQASIDGRYPDSVFASCPEYTDSFYQQLVPDIKRQRALLAPATSSSAQSNNTPSIDPLGIPKSLSTGSVESESVLSDGWISSPTDKGMSRFASPGLSDLVNNMSPPKVDQLIGLLAEKKEYNDEMRSLYSPEDQEYKEFSAFLNEHDVSYIGGHNSSNYKITNLALQEAYVLKVDNRLNKPKEVAHLLSHNTETVLLPEIASRRGIYKSAFEGGTFARSLVVKHYCEGKSLLEHALTPCEADIRIQNALQFYKKMAEVLLHLEQKNLAFTDMKNSNWGFLDHKSANLLIMDDKSIRPSDGAGNLDLFTESSKWYGGLIVSPGMDPPETNSNAPVSVDKMHAFMWGKNLYEYLTGGDPHYSYRLNDGVNFRIDHPVFKTEEGKLLMQLIKDTVKSNPRHRLSMSDAISRLNEIQALSQSKTMVREHCGRLIHALKDQSKTDEEALVPAYFTMLVERAATPSELHSLQDALSDPSTFLETNPDFQRYKQCHTMLQKIDAFFTAHPEMNNSILHELQNDFQHCKIYNIDQLEADIQSVLEEVKELQLPLPPVSNELSQQQTIKNELHKLQNQQPSKNDDSTTLDNEREKPNGHTF